MAFSSDFEDAIRRATLLEARDWLRQNYGAAIALAFVEEFEIPFSDEEED